MTLSSDSKIRRLTTDACFLAAAMLLSYIEAVFPIIPTIPLPGFKIGLSNLAILTAAYRCSPFDAAVISLGRIILTFLIFGNPTSLLFSLFGGALVIIGLWLIIRTDISSSFSFVGLSVMCAFLHNLGQLIAAFILMGDAVLSYIPPLIAASIIYGGINGIILCVLPPQIYRKKSN